MKKILLAIIAIFIIVAIYYETIGSKQVVKEIKKEVNKEVIQLKSSGFNIEDREIKADKEHLTVDFNDTEKIANYLKKVNSDITKEDIAILKGMKIGLDIHYNPNTKDAMALDIYPIKLPDIIYENITDKDKKSLKTIEDMISKKELLVHLNINKFLSGFDGYIKDIDRELKLKGAKFNGDIEDNKITKINQTINQLSYTIPKELNSKLIDFKISITNPMNKREDSATNYTIKSIEIDGKKAQTDLIKIENIEGSSKDTKVGKLINSDSELNINSIHYTDKIESVTIKNINAIMKIDNIDMEAFSELNSLSTENMSEKERVDKMTPIIQKIFSSNISMDIPNISIDKIIKNKKTIDGFKLKASANIDKNFDINAIKSNPASLTNFINAKINIEASNDIINLLSSDPRAMVMMMFLQPIDKNGKKYYDIEFTKGALKINGKPLM